MAAKAFSALGASRVVFEADATRRLYEPFVAEGASAVVPYGVGIRLDIDAYRAQHDRSEVRANLGLPDSATIVLCLGMIEPRKAQVAIAQAFAGSAVVADTDTVLVFVGAEEGSPYVEALEEYIEDAGARDRVRVEPTQNDTYQWYLACDVLVCGSDIESLPRSILEVMLFERPVASTAVFGVPELIVDGEVGFLCAPSDVLALRGMLERVATAGRPALASWARRLASGSSNATTPTSTRPTSTTSSPGWPRQRHRTRVTPRPVLAVVGYGFIGRRVALAARRRGWDVRALTPRPVADPGPTDITLGARRTGRP